MESGRTFLFLKKSTSSFPKDIFPIYCAFKRTGQENKFLTPGELISQTDAFMQRFGEMIKQHELPETIFFLDKSARPLAYIFRKLFPVYYPDTKMPEIRFINIGGSGSRLYDKDSRPFTGDPEIIRRIYGSHINMEGRIAIIDEYQHTGQASRHAMEVLRKAFPRAVVIIMIAYDKLPNWYQNEAYLGVEEYTKYDYEEMALRELNKELGTTYKDRIEILNDHTRPDSVTARFWEIYHSLEGTIPYVQRGEHIKTHYEYPKPSLAQRLKREKPKPIAVRKNLFLEARAELDRFCEEIIKEKNRRESRGK